MQAFGGHGISAACLQEALGMFEQKVTRREEPTAEPHEVPALHHAVPERWRWRWRIRVTEKCIEKKTWQRHSVFTVSISKVQYVKFMFVFIGSLQTLLT